MINRERCKASVKKFEFSSTVLAEWIGLNETIAQFQAERGKETSDDKGSDDMTSKAECKRKIRRKSNRVLQQRLGKRQCVGFSRRIPKDLDYELSLRGKIADESVTT